jgi:hypothetical protein
VGGQGQGNYGHLRPSGCTGTYFCTFNERQFWSTKTMAHTLFKGVFKFWREWEHRLIVQPMSFQYALSMAEMETKFALMLSGGNTRMTVLLIAC